MRFLTLSRNFAAAIILLTTASGLAAADDGLLAGAAAVDITPQEFPINMPGGFSANGAEKAHDPLHARALVISDGSVTLALVVVDSLGLSPAVVGEAKAIASAETGIPAEQMLICSTHTHSGPPTDASESSPAPVRAYRARAVAGIAQSMIDAHQKLAAAKLGFGEHPLPEEVFNRRWYLKEGQMPVNPFGQMDAVKMNPGTSPTVLDRPAGPTDPALMVISVVDAKQKPLALWANYALHYVGGGPKGEISADYFGEFARLMPSRLGAGESFVAMMSNGASGDINNIPFGVVRPPREPFEQIRIVAQKAADTAWLARSDISEHRGDLVLGMKQRELTFRYRRPTEDQIKEARRILLVSVPEEVAKLPRLAPDYARRTLAASERKEESLTTVVQALRIGDHAICGIPFETLVEIGLDLKARSPFSSTMVIGLANARHGYLPSPAQHRLGGYETWLGTNYVEEDASVMITDALLEMLGELHGG
jgi:hypothetical protein